MKEGRVSHTALKIARMSLFFAERPGYAELLPSGAADANRAILQGAGLLPDLYLRIYRSAAFGWVTRAADAMVGGGAMVHFPLRKRFVDDAVREACVDGAEQLLVLGAGLDSLAPRVVADFEILAVELDHPATGQAKARGVEAAGLAHPRLRLVPIDLSVRSLDEGLEGTGWGPKRSVIVAEGLLMYLPVEAVQALFRDLHRLTGPGTRVVFTWLPERRPGQPELHGSVLAGISLVGEPVRFSLPADGLRAFVEPLGWRPLPQVDLRARYLAGTALAEQPMTSMERFSVVERMD